MTYKIQYTPQDDRRYPVVKQRRKGRRVNSWLILLLIVAVVWFNFCGIPDFMIPGDPQVTKVAASQMVTMLKDGASTQEAITVFCRQVLDGAEN